MDGEHMASEKRGSGCALASEGTAAEKRGCHHFSNFGEGTDFQLAELSLYLFFLCKLA